MTQRERREHLKNRDLTDLVKLRDKCTMVLALNDVEPRLKMELEAIRSDVYNELNNRKYTPVGKRVEVEA